MALSFLLRSVVYVIVAGLALASACWAAGEWAFGGLINADGMACEQSRGEQMEARISALRQRHERKTQAVEYLLAGWLTFDEATNEFRRADRTTMLPWDREKEEKETAQAVLQWVGFAVDNDPRAEAALPKLRAEFQTRYSQ
jgi:hypothetical protein